MRVLVTGGAGYIGSHVCHLLIDQGYKVTCIDSLITGNSQLLPKDVDLKVFDIAEKEKVSDLIKNNQFDLVMHFAGLIRVDESVKDPDKYKNFNFTKAKIFLENCQDYNFSKENLTDLLEGELILNEQVYQYLGNNLNFENITKHKKYKSL